MQKRSIWLILGALLIGAIVVCTVWALSAMRKPTSIATTSTSRMLRADSTGGPLTPKEAVSVRVDARAVLDPKTGYYTYSYAISNDSSSGNNVDFFAVAPVETTISIASPRHWNAYLYLYRGSETAIVWRVTEVGTLPPGYVDTGNVPPSEFDLKPGQSVTGFSFVSPLPPLKDGATFIAQGFDTIPAYDDYGDDYPGPDVFEQGVTGATIGIKRRKRH
jgi:hypothetical protein